MSIVRAFLVNKVYFAFWRDWASLNAFLFVVNSKFIPKFPYLQVLLAWQSLTFQTEYANSLDKVIKYCFRNASFKMVEGNYSSYLQVIRVSDVVKSILTTTCSWLRIFLLLNSVNRETVARDRNIGSMLHRTWDESPWVMFHNTCNRVIVQSVSVIGLI